MINFNLIDRIAKLDIKTLKEKSLKLTEESGEVAEAVLSYTETCGCGYKNKSKEDIIEECLDTIIVAASIISQVYDHNTDEEVVKKVFNTKMEKWETKAFSEKNSMKKTFKVEIDGDMEGFKLASLLEDYFENLYTDGEIEEEPEFKITDLD